MINRTKDFEEIEQSLHNKKIVYIATKNHDYIRIEQEIGILKKYDNGCITLVSKNKNYFIRILEIFLRVLILDFRKIDIVYISFLPQFIIPFLFWKFGKAQIWTDFFISLYDTLVFDRKKISEHSFLSKLLKWVDEITIQKSNVIICDTKVHGKYFIDVLGANPESMHVLYLKANENIYYPHEIAKPEKWKDKFVVIYFGTILPLQGVEVVLQTIEFLRNEKQIHFIMVGPIVKKYKKCESDTVTYINWLTQEQLADYISFSDLCLAGHFSKDISKANRTIPGKASIYAAMEKKIILGDTEANQERYIADEQKIYFVPLGDARALGETIVTISKERNSALKVQ